MRLNADLIRARCAEIEESVSRLEQFKSLSKEEFLSNQDTLDIACYRLLVAIEASFALCYHVTAKKLRKAPEEYAKCFGILQEAGLIAAGLTQILQRMTRFRNLLVRMYWKIDYGRVYETIQQNLNELRQFSSAMAGLL